MKSFKMLLVSFLILGGLAFTLSSFKAPKSVKPQMTIVNKTDSDIDEIHIGESGDLMDETEILMPGEKITIEFDCKGLHADVEATVKLVFEDHTTFSFEDTVCDGDFEWDIVNDGKHSH